MQIITVFINHKELKISQLSKIEIEFLIKEMNKSILELYHSNVKFKILENNKEKILFSYQFTSKEIIEIQFYFTFLRNNMSYRFVPTDINLSEKDKKILTDFMTFDMNVSQVAEKNKMHRHQIYHEFSEIEHRTTLNPKRYFDLNKLQYYIC